MAPFEPKIEDQLLIYLIQTSKNPETEIKVRKIIKKGINWDHLLKKAFYQGLRPLIYYNLKNYSDIVPGDVLNYFGDYFFKNTQKNLLFMGELKKVIEILEENGIEVIAYKGPVLAIMAYNNVSLREFGDIDLYVNLKDIPNVKKIMPLLGYEATFQLEKQQEAAYFKFQREYKFKNRSNHVLIEIKWKFFVPSFSFRANPDAFFTSQTEVMNLNNTKIETISAENLILLLSIHNASHYWPKLSHICDISQISSQKKFDWAKIEQKASILGFKRVLYINLVLARDLVGLELPEEFSMKLDDDERANLLAKKIQDNMLSIEDEIKWYEKIYLRISIRENNINKIKDFFKLIFSPTTDVILSFSLPYFLYPYYYLLRIFQIIQNYIKI